MEHKKNLQEVELLRKTNDEKLARKLSDWYSFVLSELSLGNIGEFVHSIPVGIVVFPTNGRQTEELIRKCYDLLFKMALEGKIPFEMIAYKMKSLKTNKTVLLQYVGQFKPKNLGHALSATIPVKWESMSDMILREAKIIALSGPVTTVKLYCRMPEAHDPVVCYMSFEHEVARKALNSISKSDVVAKLMKFPKVNKEKSYEILHFGPGYVFTENDEILIFNGHAYYKTKSDKNFEYDVYDLSSIDIGEGDKKLSMKIAHVISKLIEDDIEAEFEKAKYVQSDDWISMDR